MAMTKAEKAAVEALQLRLALNWPTEAVPAHLFTFGDYDREAGPVEEGTYYVAYGRGVDKVVLRKKRDGEDGWKTWRFNDSTSVFRGRYFASERDACLAVLWDRCRDAARDLRPHWQRYEGAE